MEAVRLIGIVPGVFCTHVHSEKRIIKINFSITNTIIEQRTCFEILRDTAPPTHEASARPLHPVGQLLI